MKAKDELASLKADMMAECHPDAQFFRVIEKRVTKIIRISGAVDSDLYRRWWDIRTEFVARNPAYLEMI